MKSNKYWQERQKAYFSNIERDENKLLKKLYKEYSKEAKRLNKEIASYYIKYGKDNIIEYKDLLVELHPEERDLLIEDIDLFFELHSKLEHLKPIRKNMYKVDRLESLNYAITKGQLELGLKEEQLIMDHLSRGFSDTYYKVIKDMNLGVNDSIINDSMARDLVNTKWLNGKNFSDRLWTNKQKLIDYMTTDFKNGVIRGDNYNKLGNILKRRFIKRSKNDIKRLIYTEGTFVQNQAMARPFEDMGYDTYIYDAILDNRTSDTCEGLNGQEFLFKDKQAGVNFPPMHSWCRSSFMVKL
ncbi:minor capsid protein [Senegalia massiliensis]|uniref:Phage head morphogenesis protein n=1 Tax=Senegalia massiliensis TaxID=1720316 RepID=A0A845R6X2_9CLOT|nr:minor capsid protein [Senegalia massiliensis]NBI08233.1 phage head morphogenesis protein [Senegalia massiliensis]